jgi:hypothetical protein
MHLRFNWQALQQHTGNDSFNICTIIYNKENIIIMKFRSQSKDESNRSVIQYTLYIPPLLSRITSNSVRVEL